MNRRTLLKYLLTTPLAATIDYEQLLWIPNQQIVVPSLPQIEFYGGAAGGGKTETWMYYCHDMQYIPHLFMGRISEQRPNNKAS